MDDLIIYPSDTSIEAADKIKARINEFKWEREFWKNVESIPTPPNIVEEREGGKAGTLEYFPEEYTLEELTRLFPGWSCHDVKTTYIPEVRCFMTQGYVKVRYITAEGEWRERQIYAVGASFVEVSTSKEATPSQPDDRAKASRTEWIKLIGKWLGIGKDIYTQRITDELIRGFNELIEGWESYAKGWQDIFKNLETGQGVRKLLKTMPQRHQWKRVEACLPYFNPEERENIMRVFASSNNKDPVNTSKFEDFIKKVEHGAQHLKNKNRQE